MVLSPAARRSAHQVCSIHPGVARCEQEGFGINAIGLGLERIHTPAGEINQSLGHAIVGLAGVEQHGLLLFDGSDDALDIGKRAGIDHKQLLEAAFCRIAHQRHASRSSLPGTAGGCRLSGLSDSRPIPRADLVSICWRPFRSPSAVQLSIGCLLELHCEVSTPLLALVHPHQHRQGDLLAAEQVQLQPERTLEVLADGQGNRWCRLMAASGKTTFQYGATIHCSDSCDPVVPSACPCPVQALPIDTYPFLNPSTYCDTPALMDWAWTTFRGIQPGWPLVQAICDWVHQHIRFDYGATTPHKSASQTLADGAGVCRDFAHLAITLCRCLNIPARYCTGYLGYTGIAVGDAPVDFSAWFEVFLGDRWYVFDARHNIPRCGRVLIGRGRDAADVPFLRSFGEHRLLRFEVITERIDPAINPAPLLRSQST
jgi:hypothetical protein